MVEMFGSPLHGSQIFIGFGTEVKYLHYYGLSDTLIRAFPSLYDVSELGPRC